jgi:L-seryl-tRNA(Ser) seleniumtransferase
MISLRNIPAIDEILLQDRPAKLVEDYSREFIVDTLRQVVEDLRQELKQDETEYRKEEIMAELIGRLERKITNKKRGTLQSVINGTGVVLHTNLGRAPLGNRAMNYLNEIASGYNNLEMDLAKGLRGSRYTHVENLLVELTGAEAGLVVNNNAAAVLLGLTSLAKGKEVIVSRGQLIEIGGAFRIPEVMKLSGATLVEVGTTNKTYISDYAKAITEDTKLLFSAHTSNYKIVGFSEEVRMEEIVQLGREKKIPVMLDLGSGILNDLEDWGLKDEPTVQKSVASGADIITFSGDKLLGGPQAGIIVGKKEYIDEMKQNQLTRALRIDKLTIAALEGTLLEYLLGNPRQEIPVLRMLTQSEKELKDHAQRLTEALQERFKQCSALKEIKVSNIHDMVGGGAYPSYQIPGYGVEIEFQDISLDKISSRLRKMNPAMLTRKQDDRMQISVRTLQSGEDEILLEQFEKALQDDVYED